MGKLNLKQKLLISSLGCLVLFGGVLLMQFERGISQQMENVEMSFVLHAHNLRGSISNVFQKNYNGVQVIAKNSALKSGTLEEKEFILNEMVSLNPKFDLLFLTDAQGNFIASNNLNSNGEKIKTDFLKGYNFKNENWFKAVHSGKTVEDTDKMIFGSFMSEMAVDDHATQVYGKKRFGNYFVTEIQDEYGDKLGYLSAFVNINWLEAEILDIAKAMSASGISNSEIMVLNKEGQVVSHLKNDGKLNRDFNSWIQKKNFYQDEILKNYLINKKEIHFIETHYENSKKNLVYTYSPLHHQKFVNSIGWGVLVGVDEETAFKSIYRSRSVFYATIAVVIILCGFLLYVILNKLSVQLLSIAERLKKASNSLDTSLNPLNDNSGKLRESAVEQASGIQETVSTLDEIYAMVKANTESAFKSAELSNESSTNSKKGKEILSTLLRSIDQIQICMNEIKEQVEKSNDKVNSITNVIDEISTKTKMINDIVFQTKLLSFNASVEAARAGEHGKGFSVVAEEVGALAENSGKAAKEIEDMLQTSIRHVNEVVNESQRGMENSMQKSIKEVEHSIEISKECDRILSVIVGNVSSMSEMSQSISSASKEQEMGVSGITDAMSQLNEITNENTIIAQSTFECAEIISNETNRLKEVVKGLETLVDGGIEVVAPSNIDVPEKETYNAIEEPVFEEPQIEEANEIEVEKVVNIETARKDPIDDLPDEDDSRFKEV